MRTIARDDGRLLAIDPQKLIFLETKGANRPLMESEVVMMVGSDPFVLTTEEARRLAVLLLQAADV